MKNLALFIALLLPFSITAEQNFSSGPEKNQLIELYTSEGCSSCPPADQWLSNYTSHPQLWSDIIPVAYHVDYWDYIGWPDRFADPGYSLRQRLHARQGNISQVYTPGFVVDGEEWRGWYRKKTAPLVGQGEAGVLTLTIQQKDFLANFNRQADKLTIAILGFNLKTPVKAGENKGEFLNHDFVVLAVKDYKAMGKEWRGKLPAISADYQATSLGVAAWVSDDNSLKPIQVVGGWIKE